MFFVRARVCRAVRRHDLIFVLLRQRNTCPNDCSGHGRCRYTNDQALQAAYTEWDATMMQACLCDGDFHGPDCSLRYCPFGDDPLTACSGGPQVQRIHIELAPALENAAYYSYIPNGADDLVLQYTDAYVGEGETSIM